MSSFEGFFGREDLRQVEESGGCCGGWILKRNVAGVEELS